MTLFNSRATRMLALQIPLPLAELALLVLCWTGCGGSSSRSSTTPSNPALPAPAHVVIVMEENHSYSEIIGSSDAPYIKSLAAQGASFTQSFAIAHPSEPNYLALFSGSTQGITGDVCPLSFAGATLGSELLAAGKSFTGYADGLAAAGSTVCSAGEYDRNHVPWTNFSEDSSSDSQPFTSFPTNFADLPTVAFVVPDLLNDMHDGTVAQGDAWLQSNLSAYVNWAMNNNSVLIITWDEDDGSENNQIPTIFVRQPVKSGQYSQKINHYNVLSTIENLYGLTQMGNTESSGTVGSIWK